MGMVTFILSAGNQRLIYSIQRTQYINAQNTLSELLSMGVLPIVNENDTLAVAVSILQF